MSIGVVGAVAHGRWGQTLSRPTIMARESRVASRTDFPSAYDRRVVPLQYPPVLGEWRFVQFLNQRL